MSQNLQNPHDVRVVITGMGTINPLGNNVEEFWSNLVLGKSGVRLAKNTDLKDFDIQIAGEVDLPDLTGYFKKKNMARRLDRYIIFSHVACIQALRNSGLDTEKEADRIGAVIGTGSAGLKTHWNQIPQIHEKGLGWASPFYVISSIPNIGAAYFAKEYNIQGPNFTVNSACASGNHALGQAFMLIKMGMADAMFAGGSEAVANEPSFAAFNVIEALSKRNDDPATASRPFDKDRDGFVLSEGAGVLCLEELEHAKKRGATIYGELKSVSFTCDAYDVVAPHPECRGTAAAMRNAIKYAGLNNSDIELVNTHGTSTCLGDKLESDAILRVFGDDQGMKINVNSTKSMTGHLIGASGGVEAIANIMAFEKNVIHPSINVINQCPEIPVNVIKKPIETKIDNILSNNFGFGGQNATIILSRFKD